MILVRNISYLPSEQIKKVVKLEENSVIYKNVIYHLILWSKNNLNWKKIILLFLSHIRHTNFIYFLFDPNEYAEIGYHR